MFYFDIKKEINPSNSSEEAGTVHELWILMKKLVRKTQNV